MNKAEKSLRWVVNQIPDFTPKNNEEKMLVAIKLYSEAGAEEIKRLEAENAELKERLEKVVEPPCKIGDILYTVTIVFSDGWVGDTILRRNSFSISETEVTEKNIWSICDLIRRGMAFFSKEAAEARLKELNGGKE